MSDDDLRARLAGFVGQHKLSISGFARHACLPVSTVGSFLRFPERSLRTETLDALQQALLRIPAPRRPRHADAVAARWGKASSETIGQDLGITGSRVRKIAKLIGLTGGAPVPS